MYPFLFSYSLLRSCSLSMAMSILHFLYFAGPYPWNVGNVWFTFPLCFIALCMMCMCIYICLHVCGWLCTLYDGLSWLHEWPSLVMRTLDPIVWVCAQDDCRSAYSCYIVCTFIAVWLSWSMSPSDICFPVYVTHINIVDTLEGFDSPRCKPIDTRRIHRHETLSVRHSAPNVKLYRIFSVEMGHPHCCILMLKAWRE